MHRSSATLVVVLLLLAAGCAADDHNDGVGDSGGAGSTAAPTATSASSRGTNPPGTAASVVEVFDGDSLAVHIDGTESEVRLIGVNAPERDECHGDDSRTLLAELVGAGTLILETGDDDTDQFGRLLRYVWVDGVEVNARMLSRGEAIALQTGHERQEEYRALADGAARDRRGMWELEACGPAPVGAIEIEPIEYDPAGADGENTIEEYVEITNVGAAPIDMTGWMLRDESSVHRYVFDELELASGATVRVRSGCGDDRDLDLVWCSGAAVWNNQGDTAIVQDAAGNIVAFRSYDEDTPTARFRSDESP